ncbi:MAG: DUF4388 domain-containing protein, partial [Myxococcota bacterium]
MLSHDQPSASYLRLSEEDWVLQALQSVPGLERLSGQPLPVLPSSLGADARQHAEFAVSGLDGDIANGLSPIVPLESVHWPPLLVLCRRPLAGWEQEGLRRQGVNALLNVVNGLGRAHRIIEALTRSPEWFSANLTRAPLADLLQMLASDGRSGMIWVGCPHNRSLSPNRWESGGDFCTGGSDCVGWSARLHLHTGRLVYAETPTLLGLQALTRCLALNKGSLRVHEVYMAPRRANLEGTAQQLLIRAAALAD